MNAYDIIMSAVNLPCDGQQGNVENKTPKIKRLYFTYWSISYCFIQFRVNRSQNQETGMFTQTMYIYVHLFNTRYVQLVPAYTVTNFQQGRLTQLQGKAICSRNQHNGTWRGSNPQSCCNTEDAFTTEPLLYSILALIWSLTVCIYNI
jgi:hypothetical protein